MLVTAFAAVLAASKNYLWWQLGLVLALTSLIPRHRKKVLAAAVVTGVILRPPVNMSVLRELAADHGAEPWVGRGPSLIVVAGVWASAWAYAWLVLRFPRSPIGRRPVTGLVLCVVLLFALATRPLSGTVWLVVATAALVLGEYLWFFAYWIADTAAKGRRPTPSQIGYWRPFWGSADAPYGKGPAYLDRVEARDDEQLATVQLKGLKLLLWATVLNVVLRFLNVFLYGPYDGTSYEAPAYAPNPLVPTFDMALDRQLQGDAYPWAMRWLALIASFGVHLLRLAVVGHTWIATARMAGFDLFRNTYRPLSATSIAEFYNRIYYYFKELMATFFFYPTFLRYFKPYPRLRLAVATVMAAGVGNFIYHYLQTAPNILRRGLWGALVAFHPYAVYASVLGVAVAVSLLRAKGRRAEHRSPWRKGFAIGVVLIFYCMLGIFDSPTIFTSDSPRTVTQLSAFLVSLFRP
jgi:hypothetical protein